jgi:SAM-dependent methyltransferase
MRQAAERLLATYPAFTSVNGTAEATTLPDHSVDFVTAGQAFHWFDPGAARQEFARILRPGGWVVLVWNVRRPASTPFLKGYEELLSTYAPEYPGLTKVWEGRTGTEILFGPDHFQTAVFDNHQMLDLVGVQGRLLSSSYAPEPGTPAHAPMMAALEQLFTANAVDGQIAFEYDTEVYYGRLAGA